MLLSRRGWVVRVQWSRGEVSASVCRVKAELSGSQFLDDREFGSYLPKSVL